MRNFVYINCSSQFWINQWNDLKEKFCSFDWSTSKIYSVIFSNEVARFCQRIFRTVICIKIIFSKQPGNSVCTGLVTAINNCGSNFWKAYQFLFQFADKWWFVLDEVIVETKPKMEDSDREKIRSNLSRLVLRTQWNEKLETCLLTKGVFKPKMIELIKVNRNMYHLIRTTFVRPKYLTFQNLRTI